MFEWPWIHNLVQMFALHTYFGCAPFCAQSFDFGRAHFCALCFDFGRALFLARGFDFGRALFCARSFDFDRAHFGARGFDFGLDHFYHNLNKYRNVNYRFLILACIYLYALGSWYVQSFYCELWNLYYFYSRNFFRVLLINAESFDFCRGVFCHYLYICILFKKQYN